MNSKLSDLYGESPNDFRGKFLPEVDVPAGALAGFLSNLIRDKVENVKNYFTGRFDYYKDKASEFISGPLGTAGKLAGSHYHGTAYNQVRADVQASLYGDYRGMRKNVVPYGKGIELDGRRVDSKHKGDNFYVPQTNDTGLDLYRTAHEVAESKYMERRGINRLNKFEHAMYESMITRALRELADCGNHRAREAYRAAEGTHGLRLVRGDPEEFTRLTMRNDPVLRRRLAA